MKRKLNAEDEPSSVPDDTTTTTTKAETAKPAQSKTQSKTETETKATTRSKPPKEEPSFATLGLDERLLQAVAALGFRRPTRVQAAVVPLVLNGRDVLAKARTGSGKTLAYALPLLHGIVRRKQHDTSAFTSALILVPTLELADQVFRNIEQFAAFCAKDVQAVKLTTDSDAVQRSLLSAAPDIVISTPARAWHHVDKGTLSLAQLTYLVVDEADLVFSYGHDEDVRKLARALARGGVQTILTSATLSTEVEDLRGVLMTRGDAAVLDLEEDDHGKDDDEGVGKVDQLFIRVGEDEKFLFAWLIFHLKLIRGKCVVFVNDDVDRCYRLRLFFEQFGIRSCCLNAELPAASRSNVVQEFNRGVYDIIIASDEMDVLGAEGMAASPGEDDEEEAEGADREKGSGKKAEKETRRPKKRRKAPNSKDYGVSRGIDFQNVACVLNFDLPTTTKSYTHRIGRTGRAGRSGIALSFVVPTELYRKHVPTSIESAKHDEKVLAKIIKRQAKLGREVKPWDFDRKQVEAFRYRLNDALRAVTSVAIREARVRELRQEILNSTQLKRYLEEHPAELQHLRRHDGELRTTRQQAHLRHIPDYLLPGGKKALSSAEVGFVPLRNPDKKVRGHHHHKKGGAGAGRGRGGHNKFGRKDPLKSFSGRRKAK